MFEIRKTKKARQDLKNIWQYGFNEWGEEQADLYYDLLEAGISNLMEFPEMGRNREALRMGYRSLQIRRHIIFYTVIESTITIQRVLHERMEPDI